MCPTERVPPADSKGFTLLEMLITIVVIVTGIVPLIMAFSQGIFISQDAADLRKATALVQVRLEEFRDAAFAAIASEARAAVPGFSGFDREVVMAASPGGSNSKLKQVDVSVYWNVKGGGLSTTLTTFFVDN